MTKKTKSVSKSAESSSKPSQSVIARTDDGTIQITFTIPYSEIKKNEEIALDELGKNLEVPGFRKGMAPKDKVKTNISASLLTQKTLERILPKLLSDTIQEHHLKPAIMPKFELLSNQINEDWQVRLVTCEIPEIDLGNYKELIKGALRSQAIWTPEKSHSKQENKEHSPKDKTGAVIRTLLDIEVKIPKILIEEEVNLKLSKLLESLEKLGLTLDSYLASNGKTPDSLRKEYEKNAEESLKLDLILTKIAETEKIIVEDQKVEEALKAARDSSTETSDANSEAQKRTIASILRKRAALDSLLALV